MPTSSDADEVVIDLSNITVRYRVPRERVPTFKEFVISWVRGRLRFHDLLALSDVGFQVRRGESLGIVGRNGAGKTTLLKVICRVIGPATGKVRVGGRLAPLLELGAGFDMELTGRENVFLNGAVLGRSRKEMRRRFHEIIEFAELEDFVDAPLRTYSTGMVARLAFSIATDIEPDILLLDEVLSVGDPAFQQKCLARMATFRERGATLLMVSHSPSTIRSLCDRVVWLDGGRVVADGPTDEVLNRFVGEATPSPLPARIAAG